MKLNRSSLRKNMVNFTYLDNILQWTDGLILKLYRFGFPHTFPVKKGLCLSRCIFEGLFITKTTTSFLISIHFVRFRAYLERNIFILEVRCNITIKGKYTAVGRLLLFPINGEGDSKIKIGEWFYMF